MTHRLLLRADAGPGIGLGHAARTIALAEAWTSADREAHIATTGLTKPLEERAASIGAAVHEIPAPRASLGDVGRLSALVTELDPAWVVLDGYRFGPDYQGSLTASGPPVLLIDDFGITGAGKVHTVLDQNLGAQSSTYRDQGYEGKLLLGPDHVLLRREFREYLSARPAVRSSLRRLLVTFGGSDSGNLTRVAMEAIRRVGLDLDTHVILGDAYRYEASLPQLDDGTQLHRSPANMAEHMLWADAAITAAGSTVWELCFLGVPSLITSLSQNQTGNAQALEDLGAAWDLGSPVELTPAQLASYIQRLAEHPTSLRQMSEQGLSLVDGHGVNRVVRYLEESIQ